MNAIDAIRKRRTIRRYKQEPVADATLLELVEAASLAPSGANTLPLRYVIARTPQLVEQIFMLTAWGGHVKPNRNPVWGVSAPAAFIAVCTPQAAANLPLTHADAGAAIQSILLRAVELGLGACWLGAFDKQQADKILRFKDMACLYLVAVGAPGEAPVKETIKIGESTKYFLDSNDVLHVPKYEADSISELR